MAPPRIIWSPSCPKPGLVIRAEPCIDPQLRINYSTPLDTPHSIHPQNKFVKLRPFPIGDHVFVGFNPLGYFDSVYIQIFTYGADSLVKILHHSRRGHAHCPRGHAVPLSDARDGAYRAACGESSP